MQLYHFMRLQFTLTPENLTFKFVYAVSLKYTLGFRTFPGKKVYKMCIIFVVITCRNHNIFYITYLSCWVKHVTKIQITFIYLFNVTIIKFKSICILYISTGKLCSRHSSLLQYKEKKENKLKGE